MGDANTPSVAERVPEAHVALPASPPTQAPAPDPITVRVTSGVDERERDRRANNEVDEAVSLTATPAPTRNNATAAPSPSSSTGFRRWNPFNKKNGINSGLNPNVNNAK